MNKKTLNFEKLLTEDINIEVGKVHIEDIDKYVQLSNFDKSKNAFRSLFFYLCMSS
jgi:hypothetical protein